MSFYDDEDLFNIRIINLDARDMMAGDDIYSMINHHFNRINNHRHNHQMNMMNPMGMNMNMMHPMRMNNNIMAMHPIGRMNVLNPNEINNKLNNMNQREANNNNQVDNQINNPDCLNVNDIDSKEKSLIYFYNFISFENKEVHNFKGSKLIINYYDLKKSEVYIDLNLKVGEILSNIFWQLFYSAFKKEEHKRTESNQTTEYIIKNPIYIMDQEDCPFQYSNFLYLEFNKQDILASVDDIGTNIGLKDGSEIFLRIKEEFYDDIIKFPKIPVSILFTTDNVTVEKEFPLNHGGITLEKIKKLLNNNNNFRLNVEIGGFQKNVQLITENCELSVEKRIFGAGGPALNFVDIETGKIKNLEFSKNAPNWRKVDKGLNIFGICIYLKCEAYKKEVIYMTTLTKDGLTFNLNEKAVDIKCPICKKNIKPKTCGFFDCEYQFIGTKLFEGDIKNYDSKTRETQGDNFEYFDALGNGEVLWYELNIYVLPKQSIKYLPNKIKH